VYQGEAAAAMNVIGQGMVRAYSILAAGNEVNIAIFGPGDFFPVELAYDAAPAALFYYESLTDCELQSMAMSDFEAEQAADPTILAVNARRYVGALLHVNALGQGTAYQRLGHSLRYLALRFGTPLSGKGFIRINVKLTQQDLANLCAISRETVSLELSALKATGAVSEKAKLYTVNLPQLTRLLGDDLGTDVSLT